MEAAPGIDLAQIAPATFLLIALAIAIAPFAALYVVEIVIDHAEEQLAIAAIAALFLAVVALVALAL